MFRVILCAFICTLSLFAVGCKRQAPEAVPPKTPTLRVYALGTLAGAMEPCGCVKDMLGGVDHAAELLRKQRADSQASLLVGAGPLFFLDPELDEKRKTQLLWKAEVIARAAKTMGLVAWAPGLNDWAGGNETLRKLTETAGLLPLAANLDGFAKPTHVTDVAGTKVGLAGISVPRRAGVGPSGVTIQDPKQALEQALASLVAQGAQVRIALLAVPRGEALRLAEAVPGFQLMVVGKPFDAGELNDPPSPATLVGKTLVVAPQNHLQSLASVDLYVRDGSFEFLDASGLRLAESVALEKERLEAQKSKAVESQELAARKQALVELSKQLEQFKKPVPPAAGSFFFYQLHEVREAEGKHPETKKDIDAYYREVNLHNREAFKDRVPAKVAPDQSGYVGAAQCAECHQSADRFWRGTRHFKAYETLATQNKEFNLDCVGCHVTGYEKPGGSTVTFVENLKGVQCETCHGPGSRHINEPKNPKLIARSPHPDLCASACHHPPHVGPNWEVFEAWPLIIGPGHGR